LRQVEIENPLEEPEMKKMFFLGLAIGILLGVSVSNSFQDMKFYYGNGFIGWEYASPGHQKNFRLGIPLQSPKE